MWSFVAPDAAGKIDVLVLNAGGPPPVPATELTSRSMAEAMEPCCWRRSVLPEMRNRGLGRILAIGFSGVQQPIPHLAG